MKMHPVTLKIAINSMFDFLDTAPKALQECSDALSSIATTLGLDFNSTEISDIAVAVAALKAENERLKADRETLNQAVEAALFAMREPMTLGEARKGRAILTSYSVRQTIAAARAAAPAPGKDA